MNTFRLFVAVLSLIILPSLAKAQKQHTAQELDELAYTFVLSNSYGLHEYLTDGLGMSPSKLDILVRGLTEKGATFSDDASRHAYEQGNNLGETMRNALNSLNHELFADDERHIQQLMPRLKRGYIDAIRGRQKLSHEEATERFQELSRPIKVAAMMKKYKANKDACERFLEENKYKPGVQTMENGLQYKVIVAGTGLKPREESKVSVNYEGRTIDGKCFDSSYQRGQAAEFKVNQVIKGWKYALLYMP